MYKRQGTDDDPSKGGEAEQQHKKDDRSGEATDDQSSDEGSEEGESNAEDGKKEAPQKPDDSYSNLDRLRKQKRLAMNRESARNRRKKKKEMLETMEKKVEDLNNVNKGLRTTNESLTARVAQLETELVAARSMQSLSGGAGGLPSAGLPSPDPFLALQLQGGLVGGGLGPGMFGSAGLGGMQVLQMMQLRQHAHGAGAGDPANDVFRMVRERQVIQNRMAGSHAGLSPLTGSAGVGQHLDAHHGLPQGNANANGRGLGVSREHAGLGMSTVALASRQQATDVSDQTETTDSGNEANKRARRDP